MAKKSSMTLETVGINDLQAHPRNYRGHPAEQIAHLKASLAEYGIVKNIVVASDNVILAGHGLVQAARELGYTELPVYRIAMPSTDPKAQKFMVLDNEVSRKSEDDTDQLAALLKELQDSQDLTGTGYDSDEVTQLLNDLQAEEFGAGLNEDAGPEEPPIEPVTRLGDIWVMGGHRLVCGDCTDPNTWPKSANVTLTDPPYGVGLGYASHDDTVEELKKLVDGFFPIARGISTVVALTPGVTRGWLYPEPNWVLCWFYGGGQNRSSWGFNSWQPMLVYGKDPYLAHGMGCRPDAVDMNIPSNSAEIDHPCPKPLKVWCWFMERVTLECDTVCDPFMGSGTTLIACEQLNRICYGIELEPRYVDVAVKRWQKLTGKQAILESTGEAFSGE